MKIPVLFLSCSLLATSLLAQPAVPAKTNSVPNAVEQLQRDIPTFMKNMNIPGLTIAYVHNGKLVWQQQYGVINSETKQPVTRETVFEAASLTKVVTAYAVLKLVDAGKLNLDTPLNKYLGNNYDVGNDARINLITARRVLTHSAGFPNWRPNGSAALPIIFTPGERFSYSGEGFVYLSKVAERLTNMKFEDYVKKVVFEPLHMTHSSLVWLPRFDSLHMYRHDWFGQHPIRAEDKNVNAAASLRTTAEDYARFIIALLDGKGLSAKTAQAMFTPQIQVNDKHPDVAWGLGVGLEVTPSGKYCWHWGDQGNCKCYMTACIQRKDAIVYFTNSHNGLAYVREIVGDALGGSHPAPDWLGYDRYNPTLNAFLQSAINKGAPAALQQFRGDRGQDKGAILSEADINSIGYLLLQLNKIDDAIAVFEQNTTDYPQSSNTWDSLAEGYMDKGNKEQAIQYYEKSLQLNPQNTNAVEMLQKLKEDKH